MKSVRDFLTFKTMVSPLFLQILFWAAIGGCLYGTYVLIRLDNWAWIFAITLGPILIRVIFERAILAFRAYNRLSEIEQVLHDKNTGQMK